MRVLLTNDDGPPGRESPYIYEFSHYLRDALGCDVKVVIPSSQKSWIGKAFHITEIVNGVYYYPHNPVFKIPRSLSEGENEEWILLDATPATCVNVALHNLYPGQIDLVISGPNLGRNSSAAFSLSSGTVGAAMSASVSGTRSMAVSYGTVVRPIPISLHKSAHVLACRIINSLWSKWSGEGDQFKNVGLFNINIPMIPELLSSDGLRVYWTTLWRNSYGRLFTEVSQKDQQNPITLNVPEAGPDSDISRNTDQDSSVPSENKLSAHCSLSFKFAPEFNGIVNPDFQNLPVGCDAWALAQGAASVTALAASFAEVAIEGLTITIPEDRLWKL